MLKFILFAWACIAGALVGKAFAAAFGWSAIPLLVFPCSVMLFGYLKLYELLDDREALSGQSAD